MTGQRRRRLAAALWMAVGAMVAAGPAARAEDDAEAQSRFLQTLYRQGADTYQFFADAEHKVKLEREAKPVLHWASPNDWSGDLFIWQRGGRPEVVGCILSGPQPGGDRMFFHEFHALSTVPLAPQKLPDGQDWTPRTTGLEYRPIPEAPVPAGTEKARLTQMRSLARSFDVRTQFDGAEWELRLLPQPMFRYQRPAENPSSEWLDGAVFTYVLTTGTDAEVLVLLEARKGADGNWQWQYAPARITNRPAWIRLGDAEVWRVDTHTEEAGAITRPYTTFYAGHKTAAELKDLRAAQPGAEPAESTGALPRPLPADAPAPAPKS